MMDQQLCDEISAHEKTKRLVADLVEALRAAVPKICVYCQEGREFVRPNVHWPMFRCQATAERALLSRVDAEIAAQAAERTPCL